MVFINTTGTTNGDTISWLLPADRERVTLISCDNPGFTTVAGLPTADVFFSGYTYTVTDADATTINTVVSAAGVPENIVPVKCLNRAGTWNWYIQ